MTVCAGTLLALSEAKPVRDVLFRPSWSEQSRIAYAEQMVRINDLVKNYPLVPTVVDSLGVGANKEEVAYRHGTLATNEKVRDAFIARQNELAADFLSRSKAEGRNFSGLFSDEVRSNFLQIQADLQKYLSYERLLWPMQVGGKRYVLSDAGSAWPSEAGGKKHFRLFQVFDEAGRVGQRKLVLDPAHLNLDLRAAVSGEGQLPKVTLADYRPSFQGDKVAYGIKINGSEDEKWWVRDVASTKDGDELKGLMGNSPVWVPDGSGLYYCRFPQATSSDQRLYLHPQVYFHTLGQDQSQDTLIHEEKGEKRETWKFKPVVTNDGKYLLLLISAGLKQVRIRFLDRAAPNATTVDLVENFNNVYEFVGSKDSVMYFKSDLNAPLSQLIAVDLKAQQPGKPVQYEVIIPEDAEKKLDKIVMVRGVFIASYLVNGHSVVKIFGPNGKILCSEVKLPGVGSVGDFSGGPDDQSTLYYFTSFKQPLSIYDLNLTTYESQPVFIPKVEFDPDELTTEIKFCRSKDKAEEIPVLLTHQKNMKLDGNNPVLVEVYGGFGTPMKQVFSTEKILFMKRGGVVAVPLVRGGAEKGEGWHRAAMGVNKQKSFDDVISVVEWLILHKYTTSSRLAIQGTSNGGLLAAVCSMQRPDLFAAAIIDRGVLNMLQYHQWGRGAEWVAEYGSPEDKTMLPVLNQYSPLHTIKPNTVYPAMYVTAGLNDKNVPIAIHTLPFVADLQAAQRQRIAEGKGGKMENPILLSVNQQAGHSASSDAQEASWRLSFLTQMLGMN